MAMPNKTIEMRIFDSSAGITERLFENLKLDFIIGEELGTKNFSGEKMQIIKSLLIVMVSFVCLLVILTTIVVT